MIRVLQISKYYYPFLGGTERVARDIVSAINKLDNVEQKVICFNENASDDRVICHANETHMDIILFWGGRTMWIFGLGCCRVD
mgnify:CR=1 FL=1